MCYDHAGTCLGILSNDGIVLSAVTRSSTPRRSTSQMKKFCSLAGITSTERATPVSSGCPWLCSSASPWCIWVGITSLANSSTVQTRQVTFLNHCKVLMLMVFFPRKLRWLEGDMLECCRVHVEARLQGGRDQPAGCRGPEYQGRSEFKWNRTSCKYYLQVLSQDPGYD